MCISDLYAMNSKVPSPSPIFKLNESSVGRHLSFKLQLTNSVCLTYTLLLVPIFTKPDLKFQSAGLHDVIAKESITCSLQYQRGLFIG